MTRSLSYLKYDILQMSLVFIFTYKLTLTHLFTFFRITASGPLLIQVLFWTALSFRSVVGIVSATREFFVTYIIIIINITSDAKGIKMTY